KALTIVKPGSVPKTISEGILDVMTAFAAKDEADTDKMRLMRVYVEAAEGFDESVVAATLRHLKFHNPRNPWRPTPQDVYERCKKTVGAWEHKVTEHFFCTWEVDYQAIGGVPLSPECIVPSAMVIKFLKDYLARDDGYGEVRNRLRHLTLARLHAIPAECFKPDQRDWAVAAIESRELREANARRIEALLASLNDDLRFRAKSVVLRYGSNYECGLP